jgi:hypothetical protein
VKMNGWLRRVAVVHWEVHRSQQQSLRWLRPLCIRPAILPALRHLVVGHRGSAPLPTTIAASAATAAHRTGDPSSSSYQAEYRARKRYEDACYRLRALLEAGDLVAAILDPFKGKLHRTSTALWRRHGADRMIEKGRAPIPHSLNTGSLVVKEFPVQSTPRRSLPTSKIGDVIDALRGKVATEYLTRPQQEDFVGRRFRNYHVTDRQYRKIFQEVPVASGRPKGSGKKV